MIRNLLSGLYPYLYCLSGAGIAVRSGWRTVPQTYHQAHTNAQNQLQPGHNQGIFS